MNRNNCRQCREFMRMMAMGWRWYRHNQTTCANNYKNAAILYRDHCDTPDAHREMIRTARSRNELA